jgi:hypothetical protein
MTWTVTARGVGTADYQAVNVSSSAVTVSGITAGHSLVVFVQYGDAVTQAVTVTDNQSNNYGNGAGGSGPVDNIVETVNGQTLASFVCLNVVTPPTTITAHFPTPVGFDSVQVVEFSTNAGANPTLHNHTGTDTTASSTTPSSGAATASNGDLVIAGILNANDPTISAGTITGATAAIGNNAGTTTGTADESGTTTTSGSVSSTFSTLALTGSLVMEMIFSPPPATSPIKNYDFPNPQWLWRE